MANFTSYSGPASNFPPKDQWKGLDELFNANKGEMSQMGNTDGDNTCVYNAVRQCADSIGVEDRVIFCMIMQESTGNVGAPGTVNEDGHGTCGIMQCDGSPGFPGQHGLSQDQITSMVTAGTNHFKLNLKDFNDDGSAECYYKAMREYNTGSINADDLSDGKGFSTNSYVSDLANRLLGKTN